MTLLAIGRRLWRPVVAIVTGWGLAVAAIVIWVEVVKGC